MGKHYVIDIDLSGCVAVWLVTSAYCTGVFAVVFAIIYAWIINH